MVLSNVNSEFNGLIISAFLSFIDVSRVDVSKVVFVFMQLYDFALFKRVALFSRCFKSCFVDPVMQPSLLLFPYFKLSLLIVIQLIIKDHAALPICTPPRFLSPILSSTPSSRNSTMSGPVNKFYHPGACRLVDAYFRLNMAW